MTTETTVELPECARPTCHDPVALSKSGEPLKYCDDHRDKRPSAAARKAAVTEELLATGEEVPDEPDVPVDRLPAALTDADGSPTPGHSWDERVAGATFGKPSPAPKPSAKPSKRERDNAAIAARLAAKPAPKAKPEPKAKPGSVADFPILTPSDGVAAAFVPSEPQFPPARWHKGSQRFLTIARKNGKPIYRYGATKDESEAKMREALAAG